MTNLVGGVPFIFMFHSSDHVQPMSAMIFAVSLPMWRLSLFGQQSPAAPPYWRRCVAEEIKSAITYVS
jgi:hypothetical protein